MSGPPPARGSRARAERLGGTAATKTAPKTTTKTAPAPTEPQVVERELTPDELAALEEQRAFLLTSLRDLEAEHDVGDVDENDYEQLKDDYTARAAAVIRSIDSHHRLVAARAPRTSWSRRILVIGAVAAVALLAGVLVARSAGQRNAGDTITGGVRQSTRDDLLAARQKVASQDWDGAIQIYDSVLVDDPANLEALTYRGWMYRNKALTTDASDPVASLKSAVDDLRAALVIAPDDGSALTFMAVLYGDLQQYQQALDTLAKVPPNGVPEFMQPTVDTFRQRMEAAVAATGSTTTTATP